MLWELVIIAGTTNGKVMRNTIIALLCAGWMLGGCAAGIVQLTPLRGRYVEEPPIAYSTKSFDQVWDNVVDVVAQMGFPIKLLDRANGLLVCEETSLNNTYTLEDKDGRLINPNAFVVIPRPGSRYQGSVFAMSLTGVANVRIRAEEGRTKINVNLGNLQVKSSETWWSKEDEYNFYHGIRSTGRFEDIIIELVK